MGTTAPKPPAQIDQELAARALDKRRRGQEPNKREVAALRRVQAWQEEELRQRYYRSVPKRHYIDLAGKTYKVLDSHADLYGIPVRGSIVDLAAVLRWVHEFLIVNARKLQRVDEDDPMSGPPSPALERWREEKWRLARLDRLEREQKLLPRDQIHSGLAEMADILRSLGEAMARQFGEEARQLVDEALDDWARKIEMSFGEGNDGRSDP